MALELDRLWDFEQPAESERRFRDALGSAAGDEVLILRTQIARTFSLRGMFDEAHAELDAFEPRLAAAGPEPRVRALLERGRTFRSAKQLERARPLFDEAFALAERAGLESLAADALHMLPLVESTLEAQIAGTQRLLDYARAAKSERARRWEAPALHNLGVFLNDADRPAEALPVFREALAVRERLGENGPIRIARWMIAHTLRRLGRIDEALAMQEALEADCAAAGAGATDPYVFAELALLHEARGNSREAARYRELHAASG
jgi:tetratricopeptide (TPR) repeat protein